MQHTDWKSVKEHYDIADEIAAANRVKIDSYTARIAALPLTDADKIKLAIAFGMSLALRSERERG